MVKQNKTDTNGHRQFGMRDKLAYAAGDFGCNMSFALKSYLTIFWTQYMGIDSYVMASLLLLVQVWDAINDPLVGSMIDADKRQYKRNKFLTYINVGAIGLLVAGALCFIPLPGMPSMVKNILFIAGYVIWDAFYTIANVPYGSMMPLISDNEEERAQLSTFRSAGATVGGIVCGLGVPMLVYDASNNLRGDVMFILALIMGVIGLICFKFMIRNTEIRVDTTIECKEDAPKFNPIKAFGNYMKNRACVGVTIATLFQVVTITGVTTASTIMFQSYFHNAHISGLMNIIGYLGVFIFMPFIGKIVNSFGKKEAVTFGLIATCGAYLLMLLLPITPDGKGLVMYIVCQVLAAIGNGTNTCLAFSLVADMIDYGEWKFGTREEGTTYSLYSFFRKLAQGVAPSLVLVLATMLGYDAVLGADQTAEVALTMRYLVAGIYLVSYIMQAVGIGLVYNLDKKTMAQVKKELAERKGVNA